MASGTSLLSLKGLLYPYYYIPTISLSTKLPAKGLNCLYTWIENPLHSQIPAHRICDLLEQGSQRAPWAFYVGNEVPSLETNSRSVYCLLVSPLQLNGPLSTAHIGAQRRGVNPLPLLKASSCVTTDSFSMRVLQEYDYV